VILQAPHLVIISLLTPVNLSSTLLTYRHSSYLFIHYYSYDLNLLLLIIVMEERWDHYTPYPHWVGKKLWNPKVQQSIGVHLRQSPTLRLILKKLTYLSKEESLQILPNRKHI